MTARLLVVEDDSAILEMLRQQLTHEGYDVLTAGDGNKALALIRSEDVDVAILDVMLPGISGMDLLRTLKDEAPGTEAVVTTAYATVDIAIDCLRAGAVDLLQKPAPREQLLAAVASALERQRDRSTRGLVQASRAVFASGDPNLLPEVVVRTATEVMHSNATLLLPGADGRLHVANAFGLSPEIQSQVSIPLGQQVAGRIALDRTPVLLQDLSHDARFAGLPASPHVRSSIVYPLAVGQRIVGVLAFNRGQDERPFRRADLHRASVFASLVLLALENVRLWRETVAAERMASLGPLAASITHEINNPLTYVLGNLDRIAESLDELRGRLGGSGDAKVVDEIRTCVVDAVEGGQRIAQIVRDMRTVARGGTSPTSFDLSDAIRSALRLAGATLRKSAEVTLRLGEGLSVSGAPGQITQVFLNLLVNAGQAMRESPREGGKITVTTTRVGRDVVAEVQDTGPGIAAGDLARLFEPFFTTRGNTSGTGLGLWISREIVKRHGGKLEVESASGAGATFRVTLPAAADVAASSAQPGARRARVLFVDDEEAILRLYAHVFADLYAVETAHGGTRALQLLASGGWDAVVCDLLMPDLNGIELYRRVCLERKELADLFVFVTGSAFHADVQAFLSTCRCPVLEKPLDMVALRTQLARLTMRN